MTYAKKFKVTLQKMSHGKLLVVHDLWNSSVFSLFRKVCRDCDAVTDGGRLFLAAGARSDVWKAAVANGAAQRCSDDQCRRRRWSESSTRVENHEHESVDSDIISL